MTRQRGSELVVVATIALLLAGGALLARSVLGATQTVERRGVVVTVPADWLVGEEAGEIVAQAWHPSRPNRTMIVRDHFALGLEPSSVALARSAGRARRDPSYRVLGDAVTQLEGEEAYRLDYAYLADSSAGAGTPSVVLGRAFYLSYGDRRIVSVAYESDEADADELFSRIPELSVRRSE